MKKVITTLSLGDYNPMYHLSGKSIRRYADRIGADFVKQETPYFNIKWDVTAARLRGEKLLTSCLEKLYMFDLLKKYDRVLYLDSDILVHPDAPDIFERYNDEQVIYMCSEAPLDHTKEIQKAGSILGEISNWEMEKNHNIPKYYNAGVILFSRQGTIQNHINIDELKRILATLPLLEQTYLNYLIFKHTLAHDDLDEKFNWASVCHRPETRFSSYFMHHTHYGYGKSRVGTFRKDYYKLYKDDISIEKTIETIRWQLFRLTNPIKKQLGYRLKRLRPKYWRWLLKLKKGQQ